MCTLIQAGWKVEEEFTEFTFLCRVQISVSLNKDEPDTLLMHLMKTKGVDKFRDALQSYVGFLKTGELTNSKFLPEPNC